MTVTCSPPSSSMFFSHSFLGICFGVIKFMFFKVIELFFFCSFEKPPVVDHRDVELTAVKQRYAESHTFNASSLPPKDLEVLHTIFSCEERSRRNRRTEPTTPSQRRKKEELFLLMSPSRKSRRTRYTSLFWCLRLNGHAVLA